MKTQLQACRKFNLANCKIPVSRLLTAILMMLALLNKDQQALHAGITLNSAAFTIYDDSTAYDFGDTIAIVQDGGDTIYILNDAPDSSGLRLMDTRDIIVALTAHQNPAVKGIYGIHLQDVFLPDHMPLNNNANYTEIDDPWIQLAKLAPQSIRYPGGASSKFRHPFGSMNTDNGTIHANKKMEEMGYVWKKLLLSMI